MTAIAPSQSVDQRKHPRKICFYMAVDCITRNQVNTLPVRDISLSGVFLETIATTQPDDALTLVFRDYNKNDRIHVSGHVVRRKENGIAVAFDYDSNHQTRQMHELLGNL